MADTTATGNQAPAGQQAAGTGQGNAAPAGDAGNFDITKITMVTPKMPEMWPKVGDPNFCENKGLTAEIKYLYYHKNMGYGDYVDANPSLIGVYCRNDGDIHEHTELFESHASEFVGEMKFRLPELLIQAKAEEAENAAKGTPISAISQTVLKVMAKYDKNGNGVIDDYEAGELSNMDTKDLLELYDKKQPGGSKRLIEYLDTIRKTCPDHSPIIDDDYFDERLNFEKYCRTDVVVENDKETRKQCKDITLEGYFHKPYVQWEKSTCSSQYCIKSYDPILREKYNGKTVEQCESSMFYTGCKIFSQEGNVFDPNTCGTQYVPEAEANSDVLDDADDNTSGATTLSSHVALFSLIMCIIFAFFK